MIFNKLRIFGVIFAFVFTLHGFADEECENEQYNINNECKYCNAGYCVDDDNDNDNDECVACPAGYKCPKPETDGNLLCSTVKAENSEYICPVNTYSDAGKTSCTSCGIGYTTGIVTDSEDNVSGDGLCLAFDDESGLGYGCTSSRACQMVTPQLCHGNCAVDIINDILPKLTNKEALINCGVSHDAATCLTSDSCGETFVSRPRLPFQKINKNDSNDNNFIKKSIINNILKNDKIVRCLGDKSFKFADNVTAVKTYSDVVDSKKKITGNITGNIFDKLFKDLQQ